MEDFFYLRVGPKGQYPSFLLLEAPPVKAITAVEYNRAEFSLKILGGFLDKIFIF